MLNRCKQFRNVAKTRFFSTVLNCEDIEKKYLFPTYNSNGVRTLENLQFVSGKNQYLYDLDGKKYLDFCAGIAVSNLGHNDEEWSEAIAQQAKKLCHVSNLFHSAPPASLAKTLIDNSSFDRVFFCNSGTEANEAAYKFARLYGNLIAKENGRKNKVIAFKNGFHGRSCGSLSLTYKPAIREQFLPLVPGISFADFNSLPSVKELIDDNTCAIFVEPIQGEGGIIPADYNFMQGLRELCDMHEALLVCDEIQCGLGRTGHLFGHEPYCIQPDIITLAKPLAGGLPIGAVLAKEKVAKAVTPGSHGTTFGGNQIVCSAAEVVLGKLIEPNFLPRVQQIGSVFGKALKGLHQKHHTKIKEVRLPIDEKGLFAGIELYFPVAALIKECTKEGVLFISAGENVIRLCPPLSIDNDDIKRAISVLDKALSGMGN